MIYARDNIKGLLKKRFHGVFGDADWVLSLLTGRESDFGPASAWSARLRGQRLCSEMLS